MPYTPTGPDLALFAQALAAHRPRLYITNSALHNPTGATLSPQTAHRLLNAAAAHRPHHRRGRHLRRFRARALAAPRRARRPRPRDPHRQLLQDAVGLDPLRLHRGAAGLDRGARRSPGRDQLRRTEPGRGRTGRSARSATAAIASIWTRCASASRRPRARRSPRRSQALGIRPWIEPRGGFSSGAACRTASTPPTSPARALGENVVLAPGNVFSLVADRRPIHALQRGADGSTRMCSPCWRGRCGRPSRRREEGLDAALRQCKEIVFLLLRKPLMRALPCRWIGRRQAQRPQKRSLVIEARDELALRILPPLTPAGVVSISARRHDRHERTGRRCDW